ncbi:maleylpyruvate isomerase mycothiol-dependent enzyme family protein [Amycolatopsis azurea]|uniref:Mycothiol-dependent maleylpyruvate isomerase metal-binding domain-containing protein n=1 Tax=Amycolatopsis azurea DSM 43854 TaxID=1238180 RepID=M2Q9C0_9PSEU|nr:hypothetical protein [Amycolatopsis azurea]EMD28575.1 hypothetical protein C791_0656 [Amycolatopsis azurea DSM 43854]OOC02238.1 hypothetical protein B0293_32895 [Amycolatopsis azurea DSM 43854]
MTVTPDDLDAAIRSVTTGLHQAANSDWSRAPGTGDLDAWQTAEHLGDCLISYAGQLIARPSTPRFVCFEAVADKTATPSDLLEFVTVGGGILAAVLRTAAPDIRAPHRSGNADLEGFAGMGCIEALVHGEDMARGLGVSLDPPRDVCSRVLARMFPEVDAGDVDPWTALLWATDRTDLPGRPSRVGWQWRGAPLDDPPAG